MFAILSRLQRVPVRLLAILAVTTSVMMMLHSATAAPVNVRFPEGVTQAFLLLYSLDGRKRADGELRQTSIGDERLVSRLMFRFFDGSLHDETVVFSQKPVLTLVSYTLVQQGPSFPLKLHASFERKTKTYTVRSQKNGQETEQVFTGELDLPPDVYNGLTVMVLKNLSSDRVETIHFINFMPEPELYEVEILSGKKEMIQAGELRKHSRHYELKPKLSTIRRFLAKLFGKTVPAYHVWILADDIPAFVRFEGPLSEGGPPWRIELGSSRLSEKK